MRESLKNLSLGPNFMLGEFVVSRDHPEMLRDFTPSHDQIQNAYLLTTFLLEHLRGNFGPIIILSGIRTPELNAKLSGSSATSQHLAGAAVDFVPSNMLHLKPIYDNISVIQGWKGQVRYYPQHRFIHVGLPEFGLIGYAKIVMEGIT